MGYIISRHLRDVFKTFLRRTARTIIYRRSHFWEIYGQCTKFPRVIKISQVLIFHFTAPYGGAFRTWLNIYNGVFFAKIPNGVELLTFSQEKLHPRCLTRLKIGFWLRVLHIELTFVPNLQIKPKKYSARKYVWHHFWKGERSW